MLLYHNILFINAKNQLWICNQKCLQKIWKYVIKFVENQMKKERKKIMIKNFKNTRKASNGITLIALVITIIVNRVYYDKNKKYSNLVGSPIIYINL